MISLVGLGLACFLASATLLVELGSLVQAREDARQAADAAALAGVTAYLDCVTPVAAVDSAIGRAKHRAGKSHVLGRLIDTTTIENNELLHTAAELTVEVVPDKYKVRAWVRPDSLNLFFAPILKVVLGTVEARATAQAAGIGSKQCLTPWGIPDRGWRWLVRE